jgi:hypothetical protein
MDVRRKMRIPSATPGSAIVRALLALTLVVTFAFARNSPGTTAPHSEKTFDGTWWLSSSAAEQLAFRDGLADCHLWELKGSLKYERSAQDDADYITGFYHANPRHSARSVYDVFLEASTRPRTIQPSGGEHFSEPHGYWDGLWWKGFNEPELALSHKGFVEGYLWCYSEKADSNRGTFSKTTGAYTRLISDWYAKSGNDETKIADVLFKFRDLPGSPPPTH